MSIVEMENLTRSFGALVAVDALSLKIEAGETFALLGPNGAGKSTTIKMLTTLLPPTSGTASLAGSDMVGEAREVSADHRLRAADALRRRHPHRIRESPCLRQAV